MRWCRSSPPRRSQPEIGGQFAAIGIVKGKKFDPDARMNKILTDAIAIANAAARTVSFHPRESEGFGYYSPTSKWLNPLFVGGYDFTRPPPEITKEGVKPYPYTGARTLDARAAFFYVATGVTPAMVMRLPDIGSQYLFAHFRLERRALRRRQDLQGDAAAKHSGGEVLVVHPLRQPDALDASDHAAVPARRQPELSEPGGEPNADGSTTVYFGPSKPDGVKRRQLDPDRARQGLVHDPAAL